MQPDLKLFIDSNPDPRELKRALAVQMAYQNYRYEDIQAVLQVSLGFISKWKQRFAVEGVKGLRLGYRGASPYLSAEQRAEVLEWLKQKQCWHLPDLQQHLDEQYGVEFASKQSYYELFHAARIDWKKTRTTNPKRDPELVEKKTEITAWLEHPAAIESGELMAMYEDKRHLLWGNLTGYAWGKSSERIEISVTNIRDQQTYDSAIDFATRCLIPAYDNGKDFPLDVLQHLMQQYPNKRIASLWNGATHHSQPLKNFLALVNSSLDPEQWQITNLRFAPNHPRQNPIEKVWLQARWIRECYLLNQSFTFQELFKVVLQDQVLSFLKLEYGAFSAPH